MNFRLSIVAAPTVAFACLFASCGGQEDPPGPSAGASGTPAGGIGAGGSRNTAGTAGAGTSGSGGPSGGVAGLGGAQPGGAAGISGAAPGGGGSGGIATGAGSGGGSGGRGNAGGGGAGGSGGEMIPATLGTVRDVLQARCGGGTCHNLPEHTLYMQNDDPQLHMKLTMHTTETCGKLVNTTNPAESALVKILKGPCGATPRMPPDGCIEDGDAKCIPPEYIAAIEQWITKGAPQ